MRKVDKHLAGALGVAPARAPSSSNDTSFSALDPLTT
ncbi:hypothetical protein ACVJBD_005355 [Rhizobium mongolense]